MLRELGIALIECEQPTQLVAARLLTIAQSVHQRNGSRCGAADRAGGAGRHRRLRGRDDRQADDTAEPRGPDRRDRRARRGRRYHSGRRGPRGRRRAHHAASVRTRNHRDRLHHHHVGVRHGDQPDLGVVVGLRVSRNGGRRNRHVGQAFSDAECGAADAGRRGCHHVGHLVRCRRGQRWVAAGDQSAAGGDPAGVGVDDRRDGIGQRASHQRRQPSDLRGGSTDADGLRRRLGHPCRGPSSLRNSRRRRWAGGRCTSLSW